MPFAAAVAVDLRRLRRRGGGVRYRGAVAVVRLAVTALLAAAGDGAADVFGGAARLPRLARRWLARFATSEIWRWLLVLGLAWWLWSVWAVTDSSLFRASRDRVGGAVPWLNFPGPKVTVLPLAKTYDPAPKFALESLLMVWLLTSGGSRGGRRQCSRAGGGEVGQHRAGGAGTGMAPVRPAVRTVRPLAAPPRSFDSHGGGALTLLIYLHLAAVARQEGAVKLGRSLAARGGCGAVLMATPPVVTYLLRGMGRRQFDSDAAHLLAGVYVAAAPGGGIAGGIGGRGCWWYWWPGGQEKSPAAEPSG